MWYDSWFHLKVLTPWESHLASGPQWTYQVAGGYGVSPTWVQKLQLANICTIPQEVPLKAGAQQIMLSKPSWPHQRDALRKK